MAFTDIYIKNLKTAKNMEVFREEAEENFGVRVCTRTTIARL